MYEREVDIALFYLLDKVGTPSTVERFSSRTLIYTCLLPK